MCRAPNHRHDHAARKTPPHADVHLDTLGQISPDVGDAAAQVEIRRWAVYHSHLDVQQVIVGGGGGGGYRFHMLSWLPQVLFRPGRPRRYTALVNQPCVFSNRTAYNLFMGTTG